MGIFLEFIFLSIPVPQFVPDYQMPLTEAVKPMATFLSFPKKKPLHSTEGGKGFLVFDLLVARLISVILDLTSTKEFYIAHPLPSTRLSWYTHQAIEREPDPIFFPESKPRFVYRRSFSE
jgi:hypothetical protein